MSETVKPKSNRIELHVTQNTFNEVAAAVVAAGGKLTPGTELVLTSNMTIKNPLDLRMIAIRKDATEIASKVFKGVQANFTDFAEEVTQYIMHGKKIEAKGWSK